MQLSSIIYFSYKNGDGKCVPNTFTPNVTDKIYKQRVNKIKRLLEEEKHTLDS